MVGRLVNLVLEKNSLVLESDILGIVTSVFSMEVECLSGVGCSIKKLDRLICVFLSL